MLGVAIMPAFGQEAKIMIVERADTAKLSRAYKDYREAAKRWEEVKAEVAKEYTVEGGKVMPGWDRVQFSADFRAMVPAGSSFAGSGCVGWNGGWTMSTLTSPAIGSTTKENLMTLENSGQMVWMDPSTKITEGLGPVFENGKLNDPVAGK